MPHPTKPPENRPASVPIKPPDRPESLSTRAINKSRRILTRLFITPLYRLQTRIRRLLPLVYTPRSPYADYRRGLLASVEPALVDKAWQYDTLAYEQPAFLMICHDQQIDRRIVQQAQTLLANGWRGKVVALALAPQDQLETFDGIELHRIGLHRIVSDCPAYWRYQWRQDKLLWLGRLSGPLSRLNWLLYKLDLTIIYTPSYRNYPLPFDRGFFAAARHYPASLVMAHDLPALKAAAQLAKAWGAKLVYDSHELYSEQKAFSASQRQLLDAREREYARDCDAIITVSDSFAKVMAEKDGVTQPHVILNVTDKRDIDTQNPPRIFHQLLKLPTEHKVILYQGGIAHHRNLDNLVKGFVQVASRHPDVHLVFLGPADPKIAAQLEAIASPLLNQSIHFIAPVGQAELLSYTTSADFGVIPYPPCDLNTKYCMPNKMFEYIQACLPILANDLVEVGCVLTGIGGGGLITDLNTPAGVASGLERMLIRDLQGDRQKLFEVKDRYCWDYEAKRYLEIINAVVDSRSDENRSNESQSNEG
ncbi:MAG: glycosyltransferase [Phormidesmis sp.]